MVNVEDFRQKAKRRLPRAIFDIVDGAAGDEVTMRANQEAFDRISFRPRPLVDVLHRDQSTTVLGRRVELPILLAPAGAARLMCRPGEVAAVRAAARMGTVFALSMAANSAIEEVADEGKGATLWFQVYLWRGRDLVGPLVERAERAGYHALCLTVDAAAPALKYRDMRNGMSVPPKLTVRTLFDSARHPRWAYDFVFGPPIRFKNLSAEDQISPGLGLFRGPSVLKDRAWGGATWDELRWLRSIWRGPIVVKGILTEEAAQQAFDLGADAVICSNHGGRVLDGNPASIEALPGVLEAAAGRNKEVYLDSGVRRGSDVVKAIAMGARACLIGRPYYWGLAVGGEVGVVQVLELLKKEVDSVLGLVGCPRLEDLDLSVLNISTMLQRVDDLKQMALSGPRPDR
jgi:L-lactate dehydrogenase (cytochrome)